MKICIINGIARSGKDQFVKYFKKHYKHRCYNWSTIDKVKQIAKNHFGWDGQKTEDARLFLSEIKRMWSNYNNGPFEHMAKKIDSHFQLLDQEYKIDVVYFIHCRESKEINQFKNKYGNICYTLHLKRKNIKIPDNQSDKNVGYFPYDFFIENNGDLKNLEENAKNFIKELNNRNGE